MKLKNYLKTTADIKELANRIGVSKNVVYQWKNNVRPVPLTRCKSVVIATKYKVSYADLRPEDWHLIWDKIFPERRQND